VVIIHYNTIIHPFTLADNRHYVFYIFRYTILRHPLIKYLLAPIYLVSFYLSYQTLAGNSASAPASIQAPQNKSTASSKPGNKDEKEAEARPTTSFFLIFALTTALSLITAPLVEPRYFILPWVFWRLHIPQPQPSQSPKTPSASAPSQSKPKSTKWTTIQKPRQTTLLWLETIWFLTINGITGYIFLYRGFEWKQEVGVVQRFMW